jgi:cytochrome P450
VELPGGLVAWSVTAPVLIKKLVNDARVSKNPRENWRPFIDGEIPPAHPLGVFLHSENMFTADGEKHGWLRSLTQAAFVRSRVEALGPRIAQITNALLDDLGHEGRPVDLRARFAYPLPIEVICHLFGIPAELRAGLKVAVDGIFATAATTEERTASQAQLYGSLAQLIALKRETPGDDMTSHLIAVRDDDTGSSLSERELVDTLVLMVGAGHETTTNLIDHAITAVLTHPEQLDLVRSGEVDWPAVIEETLRWQAPVANVPLYFATEDIDDLADGLVFHKGDAILLNVAAAGRDPGVHGDDADRFDPTRATRGRHLSFGAGAHFCLGAPLARLEARIALPALFARFPNMEVAVRPEELRPQPSLISNAHRELPVYLHGVPGGRDERVV